MKCYFLLLCIPLCLEVSAIDEAKLTLLHDAVNEGAVCLDGTAPGYYMRKGEVHVCTMYIHTYYIYIYIYYTEINSPSFSFGHAQVCLSKWWTFTLFLR